MIILIEILKNIRTCFYFINVEKLIAKKTNNIITLKRGIE